MSLINDALKKAHKDTKGQEVIRPKQSASQSKTNTGKKTETRSSGWMGIVTLVVAIGCVGFIVAALVPNADLSSLIASFKGETRPSQTTSKPAIAPLPAEDTQAVIAEQQTSQPVITASPANPVESPTPTEIPTTSIKPTTVASSVPTPTGAQPEASETETNSVPQNAEILKSIYELKIDAVIGRGKKARIMIDGQVYRTGVILDFTHQYKFIGEENGLLFFKDEKGAIYERYI